MSKIISYGFLLFLLSLLVYIFAFNKSYQLSYEAKVYYYLSDYKKAYEYAKKSYDLDQYNKMAFSILTQSKIAVKYEKYIQEGNYYLKRIEKLTQQNNSVNMIKTKVICTIMLQKYELLDESKLTVESLKTQARVIWQKFSNIKKGLFENDE